MLPRLSRPAITSAAPSVSSTSGEPEASTDIVASTAADRRPRRSDTFSSSTNRLDQCCTARRSAPAALSVSMPERICSSSPCVRAWASRSWRMRSATRRRVAKYTTTCSSPSPSVTSARPGWITSASSRYSATSEPSSSADITLEVSISRIVALLATRSIRSPAERRTKNA